LHSIGRAGGPPVPPLNMLGDYAGGSLYLALGLLAGIIEAKCSGKGQVVDAAIVDGTASLMAAAFGLHAGGLFNLERGTNMLDSGAYFYDVYQCSDGKWVSVAAIEGRFHSELLRLLEIDPATIGEQHDRANWPKARELFAATFRTRTRDEWCALLEGTDACFAPVLSVAEAPAHPHHATRGTFITVDGIVQPAPAPRFSRSVPGHPTPPEKPDSRAALAGWMTAAEIDALDKAGTI